MFLTNVAVGALFRALAFVLDSAEARAATARGRAARGRPPALRVPSLACTLTHPPASPHSPTPPRQAAAAAPGPFIALQLVFAGFLIAPSQMGTHMWMIWMYYTSVFA